MDGSFEAMDAKSVGLGAGVEAELVGEAVAAREPDGPQAGADDGSFEGEGAHGTDGNTEPASPAPLRIGLDVSTGSSFTHGGTSERAAHVPRRSGSVS